MGGFVLLDVSRKVFFFLKSVCHDLIAALELLVATVCISLRCRFFFAASTEFAFCQLCLGAERCHLISTNLRKFVRQSTVAGRELFERFVQGYFLTLMLRVKVCLDFE